MILTKDNALRASRIIKKDAMVIETQVTELRADTKAKKMNFMIGIEEAQVDLTIEVEGDTEAELLKLTPTIQLKLKIKSQINP